MTRIKFLLFLLALAAQAPLASATVTYAVGTCQPNLPSFATIQVQGGALSASPPPNLVKICPGTYPEQIVITYPVTLEGISDGNSSGATISVPSGGLVTNVNIPDNEPAAAQVLVENVNGEVNFSNLTVDGTNNNVACTGVTCPFIVGIFYQGSPGSVNHLTIQHQFGHGEGVGIWLEGGSANPAVTVENNNLLGFDFIGILAQDVISVSGVITGTLTADIKGNYVTPSAAPSINGTYGLDLISGTIGVTENLIAEGSAGMALGGDGVTGPVSKNTVVGAQIGILDLNCCAQVTSNAIYNSSGTGIIAYPGESQAPVTGNTIVQSGTGIDFACFGGDNVHSNTILGATNGIDRVPSGVVTTNAFYNVGTIRSGGC